MKEFIEKLIGRLEEVAIETLGINKGQFAMDEGEYSSYCSLTLYDVKEQANQLAEEYKNGWIPCSERLPSREEVEEWATFLVTIRVHGKYEIMDFCLFGTDGKWHVSEGKEVIAWKRQMPYQPKGE